MLEGALRKGQLTEITDSIVFIDEGNDFIKTEEFDGEIQKTDNFYVIVTRESLPTLPYSVEEIYGIRTSGKYETLKQSYNEFYRIYGTVTHEKEIVAFLNNHEGGILYIGIDDDGKVVGISFYLNLLIKMSFLLIVRKISLKNLLIEKVIFSCQIHNFVPSCDKVKKQGHGGAGHPVDVRSARTGAETGIHIKIKTRKWNSCQNCTTVKRGWILLLEKEPLTYMGNESSLYNMGLKKSHYGRNMILLI